MEVAVGADLCAIEEAKDFLKEVPAEHPFMATSCCPAWSMMAKKLYPEFSSCISMALTPMVLTGRLLKRRHPGCKVVFVGPCAAKKLEASRKSIRSDVDFVLTFEECASIFEAKGITVSKCEAEEELPGGCTDGRNFAVSGGVAQAVTNVIARMEPGREVLTARAESLPDCRKMLQLAKAGKYNGYLLEGMACPGGCVAGAGVIVPSKKSAAAVAKTAATAQSENSLDSAYLEYLRTIEEGIFEVQEES